MKKRETHTGRVARQAATLLGVVVLMASVGIAQEPGAGTAAAQETSRGDAERPVRELLDAVREDLVELRFEKALAAIAAILGDPGMSEAEKAEVLVLRAQAHMAFGDLDAAGTLDRLGRVSAMHGEGVLVPDTQSGYRLLRPA